MGERLLVWNTRSGGGARVDRIVASIADHDPDTVVLTEFRANRSGERLRGELSLRGLLTQQVAVSSPTENSVLLASRHSFRPRALDRDAEGLAHRVVVGERDSFVLIGLYFAQGRPKIPLFKHLERQSPSLLACDSILCGDFNTGEHYRDEKAATFIASDHFGHLFELGWIDAWRHFHGDAREYTWYSRAGNGFRIDHVLVSPSMLPRVVRADYSHSEREQGISDHSALVVELKTNGT